MLGRVDGFDQDEGTRQCEQRFMVLHRVFTPESNLLKMFEFANSLFDAGSTFVKQFWKKGRYDFAVLDIFNTD
jgi:hypothetical protein